MIHHMPQRSPEWYAIRAGKLTGSAAADALATIKSGEAAARRDLRMRLVAERLTRQPQEDGYTNAAMQRGIDCEPLALAAYEALTGALVETVGFVDLDGILAGCSPDGLVDSGKGLLSIKCPKTATHLGYIRAGVFPSAYVPQMLHEMWVTGAEFYDFLSFDDRLPADLATFYVRVPRKEADVLAYSLTASLFLSSVEAELEAIQKLRSAA